MSASVFAEAGSGAEGDSSCRALSIWHDNKTMKLTARTSVNCRMGLEVALEEEFPAIVAYVNAPSCRLTVTPTSSIHLRDALSVTLAHFNTHAVPLVKPLQITQKLVYLMRKGAALGGGFFRIVVCPDRSANCYTVMDIDSGRVWCAESERIFELPSSLTSFPPMVMCVAVPPSAVDVHSDDYIGTGSTVKCRIGSRDVLLCVDNTYPPVLVCELRAVERKKQDTHNNQPVDGGRAQSGNSKNLDSRMLKALPLKKSASTIDNVALRGIRPVQSDSTLSVSVKTSAFSPYHTPLPCHLTVCISERVSHNVYRVRDTKLLTILKELLRKPLRNVTIEELSCKKSNLACIVNVSRVEVNSQQTSRCRLYRGVLEGVDRTQQICTVLLVDYGQTITCNIGAVFDISDQPREVQRVPCASFLMKMKTVSSGIRGRNRNGMVVDQEEYNVSLMSQEGDCFVGTLRDVPRKWERSSRRRKSIAEPVNKQDVAQRKEEIRRRQEALEDAASSLKEEREKFEASKSRREQDIAMMTMQLQMANISRKLDTLSTKTSSGIPIGMVNPAASAPLQMGNNFGVPPSNNLPLVQSDQLMATKQWLEQSTTLLHKMQQGERVGVPNSAYVMGPCGQTMPNPSYNAMVQPPLGVQPVSPVALSSLGGDMQQDNHTSMYSEKSLQKNDAAQWSQSSARPMWNAEQKDAPNASTCSVVLNNPIEFRSRQLPFITASSGHASSTVDDNCRTHNANNHEGSEYGAPPKHFLSELERMQVKREGSDDGNAQQTYQRTPNQYRSTRFEYRQAHSSCTLCQGQGHFSNNCPIFGGTKAPSHTNRHATDVNSNASRKEMLYVTRSRDKDGNLLYTSDESDSERSEAHCGL